MDNDGPVVLEVEVDPRWLELPVRSAVETDAWALGAIQEALALRGATENAAVRHLYVQTYAAVVEDLRERAVQHGLVGAYALIGDEDLLPVTVAELAVHSREEALSIDAAVNSLVVAPSQRFSEPEVVEVRTDFGPAVRLQQLRIVDEGAGQDPTVQTSVVHVWLGPTDHHMTTLSSWFGSPVDAETSREVLQALAVSLRRRAA